MTLKWNQGVHNYMVCGFGDIPVGAYDSTRLSNMGIGHGGIDFGAGYTYLNPTTGIEFSGVGGFTYNFKNPSTQYQHSITKQNLETSRCPPGSKRPQPTDGSLQLNRCS